MPRSISARCGCAAKPRWRSKQYRTGARDLWYSGVYVVDGVEADIYGLAAYRIPGTPFEPYLYDEYYRWPTPIGDQLIA